MIAWGSLLRWSHFLWCIQDKEGDVKFAVRWAWTWNSMFFGAEGGEALPNPRQIFLQRNHCKTSDMDQKPIRVQSKTLWTSWSCRERGRVDVCIILGVYTCADVYLHSMSKVCIWGMTVKDTSDRQFCEIHDPRILEFPGNRDILCCQILTSPSLPPLPPLSLCLLFFYQVYALMLSSLCRRGWVMGRSLSLGCYWRTSYCETSIPDPGSRGIHPGIQSPVLNPMEAVFVNKKICLRKVHMISRTFFLVQCEEP